MDDLKAIALHSDDDVMVALVELAPETMICNLQQPLKVTDRIAPGHKIAIRDLSAGDEIRKYGEVIGLAACHIKRGQHVHVHNLESQRGRGDLAT